MIFRLPLARVQRQPENAYIALLPHAQFLFLRWCQPFFALRLQQGKQVGEFAADVQTGPHEALGFKGQLGGDGADLVFFGELDADGLSPFAFEQLGCAV